ncbi:MAG TPA: FtsX-like permease family protein [Pseudobacteroides sp.]|uniref:ABC transporter permease n=1 Tax=Pseudobacteroides sp. TaxID=1968840 RepID=UPI002F9297A9
MNSYKGLTIKYLKEHKARTILTLTGIIIAISMFTVIGGIYFSGKENEIEDVKESVGNYEIAFLDVSGDKLKQIINNSEIKNGGTVKEIGDINLDTKLLTGSLRKVHVKAYDTDAYKDIFKVKMAVGRLPGKSNEVIVDRKYYNVLKEKGIADTLEGTISISNNKSHVVYKIVGAYESNMINNTALGLIDNNINAGDKYIYYANLKDKNDKMKAAESIAKVTNTKIDPNSSMLYLIGQGPDKKKNDAVGTIFFFIFALVVVCTVVVIYNAFSISVMERIKHFGILRSIGATKGQISSLVIKEAIIMSGIAVPAGITIGYLGAFIVFGVMMSGFLGAFKIGFYPKVVLVAAALGIATVFISVLLPAFSASRVSPVDAIKGTNVLKGEKIKRRRGRLAKLFFGFEGQVAYKNIKRNRKRFYVTCISLSLSLIMFIFFSNLIDIILESNKIITVNVKVQAIYMSQNFSMGDDFGDKLAKINGIKDVYKLNYVELPMLVEKSSVNKKFVESLVKKGGIEEYRDYYIPNVQIISYDKKALEFFNKDNKKHVDYDKFRRGEEVIIVNKAMGNEDKSLFYDGFTSYKKGQSIKLPKLSREYINKKDKGLIKKFLAKNDMVDFKISEVVDYETLNGSPILNGFGIIMSDESFKRLTGVMNYNTLGIMFDSQESRDGIFEKLNVIADENSVTYYDIYEQEKKSNDLINQLMILVYGFISLIVLISGVNIINTVTINLLVKKREYAVFKAIGMTKWQFIKLVLLEGTLFGVFACIAGIPAAFLLTKYGVIVKNPLGFIGYTMPVWPYIAGSAGVIAITFLAVLIPLRKLNEMNIVEALRVED